MLVESIRNFAKNKPGVAVVLACVPLALAGMMLTYSQTAPAAPNWPLADFIDEETGEALQMPGNEVPPLIGKSGKPTIVLAVYLTPSTPDRRFLAYLQKLKDETKAKIEATRSQTTGVLTPKPEATRGGILVRRPEKGSPWIDADSAEGVALLKSIYHPDPKGEPLRLCPPEKY